LIPKIAIISNQIGSSVTCQNMPSQHHSHSGTCHWGTNPLRPNQSSCWDRH